MKIINDLRYKILKQSRTHVFIKLSLTVSLLLVSINLLAPKPAQAISPDNPLLAFVMPGGNYNYLINYLAATPCTSANHQPRSPAVTRWVSLANDPVSTTTTVSYGTNSINLRYWTAGVICYNSKAMRVSDVLTSISLDPSGTSTFSPSTISVDYDWSNPGSYNSANTSAFTYSPTGRFTQSGTYNVHVYGRVGIRWSEGGGSYSYVCVANGVASNAFYSNCPTEDMSFSIYVVVRSNWNYIHNSFNTGSHNSAPLGSSPYPEYPAGTNITINSQLRNNDNGRGRTYTHRIPRDVGGDASNSSTDWSSIQSWESQPGIAGNSNGPPRSATYTIPDRPGERICFRAIVAPVAGQSTPTYTTTDNGPRYSGRYCIKVSIPAPVNRLPTGTVSGSCSVNISTTVTDPDYSGALNIEVYKDTTRPSGGGGSGRVAQGTANNTFTWANTRQHDDYAAHVFRVYARDVQSDNTVVGWVLVGSATFGPCATPTCTITTNPSDIEPGQTFTVSSKINYSPGLYGSAITDAYSNMAIVVTAPDATDAYRNLNVVFTTIDYSHQGSDDGKGTTGLISANQVGKYTIGSIIYGQTNFGCTGDITASNKPYVSFFGNDVFAGISNGCTGWNYVDGKIRTFTRADYAGSSVQFAAMALGAIDDNGFSSASLRGPPTVEPNRPNGLTMANTTSPLGNLGVSHCVPNYWSKNPGSADTTASLSLTGMASQRKLYDLAGGSLTISGEVGTSQHLEIYVDGDVVIDNNITYAGSGGWASISEIPSLYLIVKGKIYITGGVTQLDGTYIAQPKDGITDSGTIYTCSNGSATYGVTDLYTNCGSQLVINGSFIAQKVKLLRTFGSLRYASPGEYPNTGVRSCGPSLKAVCAAELFNFSPETYLTPGLPSTETPYESITSLPPIL